MKGIPPKINSCLHTALFRGAQKTCFADQLQQRCHHHAVRCWNYKGLRVRIFQARGWLSVQG